MIDDDARMFGDMTDMPHQIFQFLEERNDTGGYRPSWFFGVSVFFLFSFGYNGYCVLWIVKP